MSILTSVYQSLVFPTVTCRPETLQRRFGRKWVVLTGASSGIGQAMAYALADAGANLVMIARREEPLRQIAEYAEARGSHATYYAIDLRNRDDLNAVCNQLAEVLPQVDYLFCNAGKSIHRDIMSASQRLHDYDRTMDVNYRSMVALSLALLPQLKQSQGSVVYSSSVSTLYPPAPGWSAYHASKCAANVWLQTAQSEWHRMGISIGIAYLPLVHTPMSAPTERYRTMPGYSAAQAANILLRLAMSRHQSYKPWWARITAPLARIFSPVVLFAYRHL